MSLPYERTPRWISPSALGLYVRDPLTYYFRYLGPEEYKPPATFQTPPMAVGQAFDTIAKTYLGAHVPLTTRHDLSEEVKKRAQTMFKGWLNSGAPESLPEGLLPEPGWSHTEKDKKPMTGEINGVPVGGYPDATWRNDLTTGILDWKVTGAYAVKRPLPKDGYRYVWGGGQRIDGLFPDQPIEDTNKTWARQLAIYAFIEELADGSEPVNAIIEQIIGEKGSDAVLVARYQSKISADFQRKLIEQLKRLWQAIQDKTVVDESKLPDTDLDMLRLMI